MAFARNLPFNDGISVATWSQALLPVAKYRLEDNAAAVDEVPIIFLYTTLSLSFHSMFNLGSPPIELIALPSQSCIILSNFSTSFGSS